MILSQIQIEEIAAAVTLDFNRTFTKESEHPLIPEPVKIDRLATTYLGLDVSYERLSLDGSILGLTTYMDTEYTVYEEDLPKILELKRNQILLDTKLKFPSLLDRKRRFTLAHECAHQILFQLEYDESVKQNPPAYSARKEYSCRTLQTRLDWVEWQADTLGAAILMPQEDVERAMWYFTSGGTLRRYKKKFSGSNQETLEMFCKQFAVSRTAAVIRLNQFGYIEDCEEDEWIDLPGVF